ncbi:hypothetical protein OXPF_36340 [Oxobacter pfennigii]|uniref:Uncharacterized protein n=1 Tax=Oxobacter pfennigii TaxID=36849 RepID=A0A0P8WX33_9CLOT|nr:hypothetical protein [Oxobacter pfennigii]KPU42866.1 hypothetical protein OXPF_36340 [Oxobacter pfennigii]
MKRQSIFTVILLFVLALHLTVCGKVQGVITEEGDENAYSIEFSKLNTEKTHELLPGKNYKLQVEITHKGGNIKLAIEGEKGYRAYTGNNLTSCIFTVGVPESGKYTVTVGGENAGGKVRVFAICE